MLNKLLEDGNTLYRRNRFEEAAHRYQYAVKRLPPAPQQHQQHQSRQLPQDEEQLFEQLRTHLLLNLSRCRRKMGDLEGAAETAGQVRNKAKYEKLNRNDPSGYIEKQIELTR